MSTKDIDGSLDDRDRRLIEYLKKPDSLLPEMAFVAKIEVALGAAIAIPSYLIAIATQHTFLGNRIVDAAVFGIFVGLQRLSEYRYRRIIKYLVKHGEVVRSTE